MLDCETESENQEAILFLPQTKRPNPRFDANTYKEWGCGIPKLNDFGLKAFYCDPPVMTFLEH